jgi:1-aminocyclopropane-1-carboxylate deaminase/D-cysteine desulfhydrase-like pyridoxal-dependent ACC family enzyme
MANELLERSRTQGLSFTHVVVASGSGGTHAGLAIGLAAQSVRASVVGYCVSRSARDQRSKVAVLIEQACAKLGVRLPLGSADLVLEESVLGARNGQPTAMQDAVALVASQEGIMLDPVYTGKAMAGLICGIRTGRFGTADRVVFMHTGGAMAMFAYPEIFEAARETTQ